MGPTQLMLCLLSAVFVKSSMLQLRHFEPEKQKRADAYTLCQEKNMTLVTLYDEDDAKSVFNLVKSEMPTTWVGLKKILNNNTRYPMCPTTSEKQNCSSELFFSCEKRPIVDVRLNWCAAKQYCQYHSLGDLGNSTNLTTEEPLWIGGNISEDWAWDDGGCSTYRKWKEISTNIATHNVTTMDAQNALTAQTLETTAPVVCSKGDVRIVVINHTRTWEQALDYCDKRHSGLLQILTQDHQASVEQWLNGTGYNGTFWVGLRQSRVFGFWIWKDRVVDSSNWKNEEPPEMPQSHECGVIHVPSYKWEDHNCMFPLPFLCEERIVRLGKKG